MIERTRWWGGRQMLIWGVHVHVGISSAEKVVPILNAMLVKYPHLLALSRRRRSGPGSTPAMRATGR